MGICTNKPRATTEPVLEALDLGKYFQAVCCGDVPHRKPDPRHVFETLEAINSTTESAVFVGDSETDMAAARNARIPVIAVSFGYRNCTAEELDSDVLIHGYHDFMGALDEISRRRP
jgi:phosphoglycolate phosphatase